MAVALLLGDDAIQNSCNLDAEPDTQSKQMAVPIWSLRRANVVICANVIRVTVCGWGSRRKLMKIGDLRRERLRQRAAVEVERHLYGHRLRCWWWCPRRLGAILQVDAAATVRGRASAGRLHVAATAAHELHPERWRRSAGRARCAFECDARGGITSAAPGTPLSEPMAGPNRSPKVAASAAPGTVCYGVSGKHRVAVVRH
jgi:hypothetical protein